MDSWANNPRYSFNSKAPLPLSSQLKCFFPPFLTSFLLSLLQGESSGISSLFFPGQRCNYSSEERKTSCGGASKQQLREDKAEGALQRQESHTANIPTEVHPCN
ncbi:hypothetical protein ATANTOWER_001132 [Ataeniobius toweri]|uniref:Uncharacterized protein n=1 Tax=Ataeniobius toweri TaxID=208326 RepID=A0ABU7BEU2_9TELE|nr:hypothetical protein [Ataeniobius toweri]